MHLQAKTMVSMDQSQSLLAQFLLLLGRTSSKNGRKQMCFFVLFGDGAVEEGVAQIRNLAKTLQVPVIFVVENNLFASHMHLSQRQPHNSTCRFADANSIDYQLVDGNDFGELFDAFSIAVEDARQTCGQDLLKR